MYLDRQAAGICKLQDIPMRWINRDYTQQQPQNQNSSLREGVTVSSSETEANKCGKASSGVTGKEGSSLGPAACPWLELAQVSAQLGSCPDGNKSSGRFVQLDAHQRGTLSGRP